MTKERLKEQVTELLIKNLKQNNDSISGVINRAVASGSIDFSEDPDDSWSTAKVIMCVLMEQTISINAPLVGKALEDYKKLSKH